MNEMRKNKRIIYDGEARFHLNDLVHFDAEIFNISSGGMLIGITSNKVDALGGQYFLSGRSMLVEFSLPSSEGRLLSVDVKFSRIHSHDFNHIDNIDRLQLGVSFSDREQPGCIAVQEYIDLFDIYSD